MSLIRLFLTYLFQLLNTFHSMNDKELDDALIQLTTDEKVQLYTFCQKVLNKLL